MSVVLPLVLVADDDSEIRELLTVRLEARGYRVIGVPDGHVALERIRSEAPAVAVLDSVMPGLTGPEVCAAVRADPSCATRTILLSARATDADVEDGLGAGADWYLTKPFDFGALADAITSLLPR